MRKIIRTALALALALGASLCVPALAAGTTFADVSGWAEPYITEAAGKGLVSGVGGGRYAPDNQVTYAQFATMLDNIAWKEEVASQQDGFTASGCAWWEVYCYVGAEHGLFDGTEIGSDPLGWGDSPNLPVSRADMAMMAYNFLRANGGGNFDLASMAAAKSRIDDIGHLDEAHVNAIAYCYAEGVLSGTGGNHFGPDGSMTRAQAAVVLTKVYGFSEPGSGSGSAPSTPAPSTATKPAGAVGGQYDTSKYSVPADANKDGWITEAEVQAVIDQLKVEYPQGTHWGSDSRWSSPVLGSGVECAGFGYMVSDKIFGNLPKYEVSIDDLRVGDYMRLGNVHSLVALSKVGEGQTAWGDTDAYLYNAAEGNMPTDGGDRVLTWSSYGYADNWPTGTAGTYIWSRYPAE